MTEKEARRISPQKFAQPITDADRLALASLLVKFGYQARLVTIKGADGKAKKAVEYIEEEHR